MDGNISGRFLIELGVSKGFVRTAFTIMDKIDSERNAILDLINALFMIGNLRQIPKITLSSEQLRLSESMEPYSWDKFYIANHVQLRHFLAHDGSEASGGGS